MLIDRIIKTKDGKIKIYEANGGPSYTFWTEEEFREFTKRNLSSKPRDIPLQEAAQAIIKIVPTLDVVELSTIKSVSLEELKVIAGGVA